MDLILWRHAEAEDGGPDLPDARRRLTARGEKQARQMAKWLRKRLPDRVRMLVSPASRARQTARALELPFEIEPEIGTGADATQLLTAAGWPDAGDDTVVLVGHQPTLGRLAALLLSGAEADWTVKKGAVWWFSNRTRGSDGQTVLKAVMDPEML